MSAGTDYERLRQLAERVRVRSSREGTSYAILHDPEGDGMQPASDFERDAAAAVLALLGELVAVREERDALAKALQDELDNWNPETRPTIAAKLEAAEAERDRLREALRQIADHGTSSYAWAWCNKVARAALSVVDTREQGEA